MVEPIRRRRRGDALEAAVLDAAWEEINTHGYAAFAVDAVAARAGTSKAVLYRRWPGKAELAHAAIAFVIRRDPVVTPDTGSLRGDVIAFLRETNDRRVGIATQLLAQLGDLYRETGTRIADLRETVLVGQESIMAELVARAVDRGEADPARLSERIVRLPTDLFRAELLLTARSVPDEDIVEMVDTIFLPLVRPL
jgi:AcrR family transcriptional regulator